MQTWTIKGLLDLATGYLADRGVDSPRLCAELLLAEVLGKPRIGLYTHFDQIVDGPALDRLRDLLRRAGKHEPVAYLVGRTEFYSLQIEVNPDCLIPRPETELLVERGIEFLRARSGPQLVLDLGTGNGCVAVAIAINCSQARVIATDISERALAVAARNIHRHGLSEQVSLLAGDLFEPLGRPGDLGGFDLIVCNPPYVATPDLAQLAHNVRDYEPRVALDGGSDGLQVIKKIAEKVGDYLRSGGALMMEIGYQQGPAVLSIIKAHGLVGPRLYKDYQGIDRVLVASKP
ncbi:MAG: peptide chain release factor N(5)-glutamine methyltransferase [Sedimentisphaerales bacterium]|nr:peptide chain release factor N(5)-glutamine methyltransferase [Sedimentisphaerales bacterium]